MKYYVAIDLKSFFASVECIDRGLDSLNTNLVVVDTDRSQNTICLAVSSSMKQLGIKGRPRLFDFESQLFQLNKERNTIYAKESSIFYDQLIDNPKLKIDCLLAKPRMDLYVEYSVKVYKTYLKYVNPSDIQVYSIDEVFIDISSYLDYYNLSPFEFVKQILDDLYDNLSIVATAGIGTNLFLAKVAMDIKAKKIKDQVKIAFLDEYLFKKEIWNYPNLSEIWRFGKATSKKLESMNIKCLGDLARYSLNHQEELYQTFGINAEILIDHAWGIETVEISDIKNYHAKSISISNGQVFFKLYNKKNTILIIKEMVESLFIELFEKDYYCNNLLILLTSIDDKQHRINVSFPKYVNSYQQVSNLIISTCQKKIIDKIKVKKLNVSLNHLISEDKAYQFLKLARENLLNQINEFNDDNENNYLNALIEIKHKHGKNSLLKLANLKKESTIKKRNKLIGGHNG